MRNTNLKADQLRDVIMKLTRMLAAKDIKVTQRGARAFCSYDSRTGKVVSINLPIIPPEPTEQFINALQGYLDHEVAHALFTNPREAKEVADESTLTGVKDKFRHNIVNVVEDVRIENRMAKEFAGSLPNLEATRQFVIDTIWAPPIKDLGEIDTPDKAATALSIGVVPYLRALGGHKACEAFVEEYGLDKLFAPLLKKMPDLEKRIRSMKSTADAARVADDLIRVLQPPPPPPSPAPEDSEDEPEDDHDHEPGEDEGEGGGGSSSDDEPEDEEPEDDASDGKPEDAEPDEDAKDEGSPDDKEDGEVGADGGDGDQDDDASDEKEGGEAAGEDDGTEGDSAEGDGEGDSDPEDGEAAPDAEHGGGTGDISRDPTSDKEADAEETEDEGDEPFEVNLDDVRDLDDELADALEGTMAGAFEHGVMTEYTRDFDRIEPFPARKTANVARVEDELRKTTGVMQKELQRMIAARTMSYNVGGFRSGRINSPALHRVMCGDERAFRRRVEIKTPDTAISLVVDNSGSMNMGAKIVTAMKAAWAFADVLDKIGVTNEVIGFTSDEEISSRDMQGIYDGAAQMSKATGLPLHHIRIGPMYMPIYKGFNEKFGVEPKKRMATMIEDRHPLAENNDPAAIEYAGARLLQRREPRKIMIVFSDGAPSDGWVPTHVQGETLKRHIARLEKSGVEVIGIGIQDSSVRSYYHKAMVLNDVSALPKLVVGELRKILLAGIK